MSVASEERMKEHAPSLITEEVISFNEEEDGISAQLCIELTVIWLQVNQ